MSVPRRLTTCKKAVDVRMGEGEGRKTPTHLGREVVDRSVHNCERAPGEDKGS
jgi:hypothetical protein